MGISAVWFLFGTLEQASADLPTKLLWRGCAASTRVAVTVTALCFVLEYAGLGKWLTRTVLVLLAVLPLAYTVLIFTNGTHGLAWIDVAYGERLDRVLGPASWLAAGYSYLLYIVATIVLIWLFTRSPLHRWPVAIILLGQLAPRAGFVAEPLGENPFSPLDPTIVLSNLTAVAYTVALFRFRLFDVVPVARETVLERMVDGMLVLDAQNRIADLNPAAQELLGTPRSRALRAGWRPGPGRLSRPCPTGPRFQDQPRSTFSWGRRRPSGGIRSSGSPLTDRRGFRLGRLLVFRDITESKRAQALLIEQQRALATLQERDRVARELHDGLGQVLGFVKMQAQAAQGLLARDPRMARVLPRPVGGRCPGCPRRHPGVHPRSQD